MKIRSSYFQGQQTGGITIGEDSGRVYVSQMTGKIWLPTTGNQPSKREIHVVVSFFNYSF